MSVKFIRGVNSQVSFNEVASELSFGTGDFTVLMRLNPDTVSYGVSGQGTLYSRNFTALELYIYQGALAAYLGGTANAPGNLSITANVAVNVGARRSGGSAQVWSNGSFGTASTNTGNVSGSGSIWFGAMQSDTSGASSLGVTIQDLGAWNVALTSAEMDAYNAGFPVKRIRPQSCVLDMRCLHEIFDTRNSRTITYGAGGPTASGAVPLRTYG